MRLVRFPSRTLRSLDRLGPGLLSRPAPASGSPHAHPKAHSLRAPAQRARFSSTPIRGEPGNRVYSPVRSADQLQTYLQLSSTSRRPLLTLWTTSWCSTCHVVSPLLKKLVESGVGEAEGGVTYTEVEYDAPEIMRARLGLDYMVNSVPTLLSFDAGEAQVETKVADGTRLRDRRFLEDWIRTEARRHGGRGGGGGVGSLFGGLFGSLRE